MAKALVEVIGDSASAVRALEATSAALGATGEAAAAAATEVDAFAASLAKAQATRVETLLGTSASLKQYSAANAGTIEGAVAGEAAAKRQAQAYKMLGIQAAATGASVTETAGKIGRGLTTYVTAPTAFIGYEAVKQAVDFNQQMLLLKTQAGDATDSIQRLSSEVLKLSSSGAPQGPVQLAEGLFHLVSLGLRGAQAMGTLREASLAAGMGMANLEDTSTALGAAVVSGIKGAQNYQQAMATLVGTAGAGNMRFQDLAASIGNVIPSAAAAGITLHEMGAALAVLTDRGMSAEEAATRLRMSLALMQRPSKAAQAALADMGVNANDLGALIRQPNGLLKVLEVLHTAMTKVGTVRGNRDLLEAFGGARSGIGIQTLVQSLDSSVSSYQGKLQQINQDQAQFAKNQQAYLESPAYKLHSALAQVETDLVKLGTALTPAVTGLAGTIATIANGFSTLPGPIKEAVGIIVGILAVGGPIGLAIKGIGAMLGGMAAAGAAALRLLGLSAATDAVEMNALAASAARVGPAMVVSGAEAEGALAGIGAAARAALGPIALLVAAVEGLNALQNAFGSSGPSLHGAKPNKPTVFEKNGQWYESVLSPRGVEYLKISAAQAHEMQRSGGTRRDPTADHHTADAANRRYYEHRRHTTPPGFHDAYTSPPTVPGTTAAAATAAAKKQQTQFNQAVHNDQMLAQARIDLANGEYAAAQALLRKDQQRLQLMLSEAKTAEERTAVLRQLAEVERLRHSKHDAFQLSPGLQEQIAKIDAEAVLNPMGMVSQQVALAKRAKAEAMRAIRSHTLTMQGLTQAWQIVGQENQVIAGALGLAHTYHAVSTAALTKGLDLSQAATLTLRERLAQAEAHRGYAPAQAGTVGGRHGGVHIEHAHFHGVHDVKKLRAELERLGRSNHQRAGSRR